MDPLYNNNPNPAPTTPPRAPLPNAMPDIAVAGSQPAPAPTRPAPMPFAPEPMPEPMSAPAPEPVSMPEPAPIPEPAPLPPMPPMPPMSAPAPEPAPVPTMEEIPAPAMSFENAFENPAAPANNLGATEPLADPANPGSNALADALNEPIQAAAPVPGSIGSAISMPANPADMGASVPTTPTNNVAFGNDAMNSYDNSTLDLNSSDLSNKDKKRKLMFILITVGAVLAIILVIIIVMMMLPKKSGGNEGPADEPVVYEGPTIDKTLSCEYTMTDDDLSGYGDAKSGKITIEENFDTDGKMVEYREEYKLEYEDVDAADAASTELRDSFDAMYADYGLAYDPLTTSYSSGSPNLILTRTVLLDKSIPDGLEYYVDASATTKSAKTDFEDMGYTCSIKTAAN